MYLTYLVAYRFFACMPLGDLGPGVIVVLSLIVVLVLSESFDKFSVGKVLALTREVDQKKVEVADYKRENLELRSQIIKIATNVSQHQSSTNIIGIPDVLARMYSVGQAPAEEVQEKQAEEQPPRQAQPTERPVRRINSRMLEEKSITKFLELSNLQQFPVVREAKLMASMEVADPINISGPIFDGYLNTLDAEIFVEVKITGRYSLVMFRDRLYMMLSKLYHYKTIKKSNVYLALVLATLPDEEIRHNYISKILNDFQPAISNGLLKVIEIDFSREEASELFNDDDYTQPNSTVS